MIPADDNDVVGSSSTTATTTTSPGPSRNPAVGAFGTISNAVASLWGWGSAGASGSSNTNNQRSTPHNNPNHATVTSHTNKVPGGWATGYFAVPTLRPSSSRPLPPPSPSDPSPSSSDPFVDQDILPREPGSSSPNATDDASLPPRIRVKSAAAGRRRTAIPFERTPSHSRGNSDASNRGIPSPAWQEGNLPSPQVHSVSTTATSSSASSPRHPRSGPSRAGTDSAVATLSRLKAQTSYNSIKNASFDSSFATVHSHLSSADKGKARDDDVDLLSLAASATASPQSRFTGSLAPHRLASPTPDASVKPGAPPPRDWKEAMARTELLDSYVQDIVYQSGIDPQGRPIILLSSPALPDPKQVDYDALLTRIMDQMELFVQNDYTVVFFAGGSTYRPPWTWIWSAYRRLSRPFRKNCRRLYICHPTFFTRSLVQIVSTGSALLSPKFARKITQVYTLSDLALHIDLTQIDVPAPVLKWNMKFEKEVKLPVNPPQSEDEPRSQDSEEKQDLTFGVPIQSLMGHRGEKGGIPRVIKDCVEELQRSNVNVDATKPGVSNLETEGIFRKSPSSALLQAAQAAYNRGAPVSLKQYGDPNIAASLLKLFFRNLPDPIFPAATYPVIRACPSLTAEDDIQEGINYIRTVLLPALEPPSKLIVFSYVMELLHKVSQYSDVNKMDASNLATVWSPNLVKSNDPIKDVAICAVAGAASMAHTMPAASPSTGTQALPVLKQRPTTLGSIVKICIERYYEIFEFDYLDYEPPTYQPASVQLVTSNFTSPSTPQRRDWKTSAAGLRNPTDTHTGPTSPASMGLPSAPGSPSGRSVSMPRAMRAPTVGSRDGQSIQSGLGLGYGTPSSIRGLGSATTVGRSASGSLRLTKARLGSGSLSGADSGFGPMSGSASAVSSFLKAPTNSSSSTTTATATSSNIDVSMMASPVTSTTSGVALTGANALGFFTGFSRTSTGGGDAAPANDTAAAGGTATTTRSRSSSTASSSDCITSPTTQSQSQSSASASASALGFNTPSDGPSSSASSSLSLKVASDAAVTPAAGPSPSQHSSGGTLGKKRSSGALKAAAASKSGGGRPLSELKEDGDE